ncbi:translation initiation factor eIF3 subunit [Sodiomyces alkalinus F11]|uniref:Eukaryotic translation initiation factor 3 subunit J n=1 Tax=Sodiomyces alkalinus (strain CBS 110278 / VKM F-3762 / F11) TaxID=1314773 RepID=A0A3N2PZ67_SODAK|nr:translation initiation factor eIF3 subunit [Sodiomyces alkalinus F11]ROT39821.1 translation initiation factor eIF3 subunit [Sodiomyces alkalinus F11]
MSPGRANWDEEESDSSSAPNSPPVVAVRRKFDDEEGEDSDVLDSWDAAEDSEVEREKAKKAAEAKAKAEAEAKANKKSKAQRIAEHQATRVARAAEEEEGDENETEAQKRERLRRTEKEADLAHAEELFGGVGSVPSGRKATTAGTAIPVAGDPSVTVNIADLPLFNPTRKADFELLRNTLVPIIGAQVKKAHYALFLQEFAKQLAKDLPSDQIKKVASTLTTLSNEKLKEEKAAQGGGKKSKASKTKATLVASRPDVADTQAYDEDAFGEQQFASFFRDTTMAMAIYQ